MLSVAPTGFYRFAREIFRPAICRDVWSRERPIAKQPPPPLTNNQKRNPPKDLLTRTLFSPTLLLLCDAQDPSADMSILRVLSSATTGLGGGNVSRAGTGRGDHRRRHRRAKGPAAEPVRRLSFILSSLAAVGCVSVPAKTAVFPSLTEPLSSAVFSFVPSLFSRATRPPLTLQSTFWI